MFTMLKEVKYLSCCNVQMFLDLPLPDQIYPESWALQERQRLNLNQSFNLPGQSELYVHYLVQHHL